MNLYTIKFEDENIPDKSRGSFDDVVSFMAEDLVGSTHTKASVIRNSDGFTVYSTSDDIELKKYELRDNETWKTLDSGTKDVSDKPSVYFDIDGTLGIWYKDGRGLPLEEILNPKNHYFRDIETHPAMIELARSLYENGVDVCIISAADRDTFRDKWEWIDKHLPFIPKENICFAPLGADKSKFVKGNAESSVLIDDYNQNLDDWIGKSVKAINFVNSPQQKYDQINLTAIEQRLKDDSTAKMSDFPNVIEYVRDEIITMLDKSSLEKEKTRDDSTIKRFKAETDMSFNKISDDVTAEEIENVTKGYIEAVLSENDINADIVDVVLSGSRCRGLEREDSDIDVVVELKSDTKEYALFNILNEDESRLIIEGLTVDINPIRAEETGTLEVYLKGVEEYLQTKKNAITGDNLNLNGGFNMSDFYREQEGKTMMSIKVNPVENKGKTKATASITIGDYVINDCKVVDGKNGLFVAPPTKPSKVLDETTGGYETRWFKTVDFKEDFYNFASDKMIKQYEQKKYGKMDYLTDFNANIDEVKVTTLKEENSAAAVINLGDVCEANNLYLRKNDKDVYVIDYPKTVKSGSEPTVTQFHTTSHEAAENLKELIVQGYENIKEKPNLNRTYQNAKALTEQRNNPYENAEKEYTAAKTASTSRGRR